MIFRNHSTSVGLVYCNDLTHIITASGHGLMEASLPLFPVKGIHLCHGINSADTDTIRRAPKILFSILREEFLRVSDFLQIQAVPLALEKRGILALINNILLASSSSKLTYHV